jgi:hypothetical protein
MTDLFIDIVPFDKQHKSYKIVRDSIGHSSARHTLNEIYNSLKPIDNNFIQQFQSNGFDSRIWELYLSAVFQEQEFKIERVHDRPDFELVKAQKKIFVEAVTSNPSFNQDIENKMEVIKNIPEENFEEFIYQLRDESTIKLAGALFNKLRKNYWDLDWVKGHPIVLAIEPFHHSLAHWFSDSNLTAYLFGIGNNWHHDANGKLIIETFKIDEHKTQSKTIPSGFFNLPNSEYISAVMFSNSGTISKFNRIGKLQGHGTTEVKMIRVGHMYDPNPNASMPQLFTYVVGENGPYEDWAQGISMYHNPKAKYPIDKDVFPNIMHGYNDDGFYTFVPEFFPIQSETQIIIPTKK